MLVSTDFVSRSKKTTLNAAARLTFPQKLQVTPENFSVGHLVQELLLAEGAQVSARNVDAANLHLIDVEFLHHPHGPVDHLVGRPRNGI